MEGRGPPTASELEEERTHNESVGRGRYTDSELEAQRVKNAMAGHGRITNAKLEDQKAENAAKGYGPISDSQLKTLLDEKITNNSKAGGVYSTNSELEMRREATRPMLEWWHLEEQRNDNERAGHGRHTDSELENQRVENAGAGHGRHTDSELEAQRVKNAENGDGWVTNAELEAQRERERERELQDSYEVGGAAADGQHPSPQWQAATLTPQKRERVTPLKPRTFMQFLFGKKRELVQGWPAGGGGRKRTRRKKGKSRKAKRNRSGKKATRKHRKSRKHRRSRRR